VPCALHHADLEAVIARGADPAKAGRAENGSIICRWHTRRIKFLLGEISSDWLDLALVLVAGTTPKEKSPHTGKVKGVAPPAPANLEALALRDTRSSSIRLVKDKSDPIPSVPSIVASWVLLVAEERPITGQLPGSVIGQIDLLDRCGEWIGRQDWIGDYWLELTDLRKALRLALHDKSHQWVGVCYLASDTEQACGGDLTRQNGSDTVACFRCKARWSTSNELARLWVALEGKTG
jgi:hypothetical protein